VSHKLGLLPPPLAGEGWGQLDSHCHHLGAPSLSLPRKRERERRGARRHELYVHWKWLYFVTSVVIRLGTSPTGMTAFTFMLSVSMAVTDLIAALEM